MRRDPHAAPRPRTRAGSTSHALLATLACVVLVPAAAAAPAAAEAPPAPSSPVAGAPAPAAGAMRLRLSGVGGRPLFALLGRRILVSGVVEPYVAGQSVTVSFYRDGAKVATRVVPVVAAAHGGGRFRAASASRYGGLARVRAVGAAASSGAREPALRGSVDGRVRRRHRAGAGRLPQDDGARARRAGGHARVRAARARRRALPRALPGGRA